MGIRVTLEAVVNFVGQFSNSQTDAYARRINIFVIVYRFLENIFLKEQGVDNDDR